MSKELFISSLPHETKIAVLEDDQLVEVFFERDTGQGLVGNIYKGRVSRVLPGMQSAFVDIGLDRDAFLYVSDFFEDSEEYDKVVSEAEAKVSRYSQAPAPVPSGIPETREAEAGTTASETAPAAEVGPPQAPTAPVILETPPVAVLSTPSSRTLAGPATPAARSGERPEYTGNPEHRGRRRRRRGRGFREGRPGAGYEKTEHAARPGWPDRPDRPARTDPFPAPEAQANQPQDFEILPGESVAKYSQASAGQGPAAASEIEIGGEAPGMAPGEPNAEGGEAPLSEASELEAAALDEILDDRLKEKIQPEIESRPITEVPAPLEPKASSELAESVAEPEPRAAAVIDEPAAAPLAGAESSPQTEPAPTPALADKIAAVGKPDVAEPIPLQLLEVAPVVEEEPASPSEPVEPVAVRAEGESKSEPLLQATTPTASETVSEERETSAAETPVAPAAAVRSASGEVVTGSEELAPYETEAELEEDDADSNDSEIAEPEIVENQDVPANGQVAASGPVGTEGEGVPSGERSYTLRDGQQRRPRFAPRRRRGGARRGPGGEVRRPESSRPGNNQPVQISELLREGQEILVQIAKEPLGTKGARITSHIALPGRYLVYMPTIHHIGVSRKISSEEERLRLRNIILENRGALTGGFIVRTAGQGRPEEELKADLRFLSTLWNEIRAKAERTRAPALMHRDLDLVQRIMRDTLSPDFKTIRADSEAEYERVLEFVNRCQPSLVGHVKLYDRETPLFEEFGVQDEIDRALKPKVWLKSGGFIVINQTEALVAIDVNTGKYVGKTNRLEDTIVKTNIDAVKEIVRQIRLRDLGGIIVIDFIDMDERRNRQKVVQALEEALRHDRAPTNILSINEFGLVALTRKRVKQSLERTLCEPCHYCTGAGWIKSANTICYEILEEARKMAAHIEGSTITLRVSPEVAQALKSREGSLLSELESLTRKDVIIKSDPTVHQERFEIF